MSVSAIFVLDVKGRILIYRDYRGDVSTKFAEKFMSKVNESEDSGKLSPILHDEGVTYIYLQHSNVYLLAVTRQNVNATAVVTFLHRLIEMFKYYFETVEEESIRDNFVTVYELLDEVSKACMSADEARNEAARAAANRSLHGGQGAADVVSQLCSCISVECCMKGSCPMQSSTCTQVVAGVPAGLMVFTSVKTRCTAVVVVVLLLVVVCQDPCCLCTCVCLPPCGAGDGLRLPSVHRGTDPAGVHQDRLIQDGGERAAAAAGVAVACVALLKSVGCCEAVPTDQDTCSSASASQQNAAEACSQQWA
jgi:hypothetical protein